MNLNFLYLLTLVFGLACSATATRAEQNNLSSDFDSELRKSPLGAELLADVSRIGKGNLSVSIVDIETGAGIGINPDAKLPLYSVYKVPIAIAVLRQVETGKLALNEPTSVTREHVAPGVPSNTARWAKVPLTKTIRELIDLSIIESDNTSTDKLLELVGGPAAVTDTMRALGFSGIHVESNVKDMIASKEQLNNGSASDITALIGCSSQRRDPETRHESCLVCRNAERTYGSQALTGRRA